MTVNEEYIGDGVYASFDGYGILLRAPRSEGDHYIEIEPATFVQLLAYMGKVWDMSKVMPSAKIT